MQSEPNNSEHFDGADDPKRRWQTRLGAVVLLVVSTLRPNRVRTEGKGEYWYHGSHVTRYYVQVYFVRTSLHTLTESADLHRPATLTAYAYPTPT